MTTLDKAAAKWKQDVQGKGNAWVAGVQNPLRDACGGFRAFVGADSLAVRKYCQNYGNFKSNVSQYESNYTEGINSAIANNSYYKGLTR